MENECEHIWKWVEDWEGNPDIPNGTRDLSHWECDECGEEMTATPEGMEPSYDDDNIEIDRQNSRGEFESDFVNDPLRRGG